MKRYHLITSMPLLLFLLTISVVSSCKKSDEPAGTDKELYDMAKETQGFTWYKYTSAYLPKSSGSGHNQPLLRTRFNKEAATKLDSLGKVMSGASFPEGSLIVKELNDDPSTLVRYAILYKKTGHTDADANGWVWGYINADGTVSEPASNKGKACIGCHSQADNIDYVLMNKYFP